MATGTLSNGTTVFTPKTTTTSSTTKTSSGAGYGLATAVVDSIGSIWSSHITGKSEQKVAEYNAKTAEAYAQAAQYSNNQANGLTAVGSNNNIIIAVVVAVVVIAGFVIIKKTL